MYPKRSIVLAAPVLAALVFATTAHAQPRNVSPYDDDDQEDVVEDLQETPAPPPPPAPKPAPKPAPVVIAPNPSSPPDSVRLTPAPRTVSRAPSIPSDAEVEDIRRYSVLPNRPMMTTGFTVFAITYGASVAVGASSERPGDRYLFTPVVGPWLSLANRDCNRDPCGYDEDSNRILLVADGVLQGLGALLLVGGLFIPEKIEETRVPSRSIKMTPISVRGGAGIGVSGLFF